MTQKVTQFPRLVFLGIAMTSVIINLDFSIANLALAPISRYFHASLTTLQWIIIIFILFGVAFQIFSGRLADFIGRKPVYLSGVTLFVIASIVCAAAPNTATLITGRALQGVALALTLTLGMTIGTSVFPQEYRGRIMGAYATIVGLSQAIGPILGGIILQFTIWRWIFLINIPFGLCSLFLITKYFHPQANTNKQGQIDFFGAFLLSTGLMFLVLALNETTSWGLLSWLWLGSLALGCILLTLFYLQEKHSSGSTLDFGLFKNKDFLFISIMRAINTSIAFAIFFIIPLFLQNIANKSPLQTGLIIFIYTAVFALTSRRAGKFIDRFGCKKPIVISALITIIGCLMLIFIKIDICWWLLMTSLALIGINKALLLPSSIKLVMQVTPEEKTGVGMGLFYTATLIGGIVGVALTGLIVSSISNHHTWHALKMAGLKLSPPVLQALQHISSGAIPITSLVHLVPSNQYLLLHKIMQQGFMQGFTMAMVVLALLALLSLLPGLFIKKP